MFVWWVFHQQPQVEVPDLVGASHVAAVDQLKSKAPETLLAAPPTSSQQVPIPNVVGYDLATAARMLRQNGLAVGSVTEEESNLTTAGDVLRTEPAASTEVQLHSRVNLVVAKSVIVR
jgi:serine/threonine-protein kinase